MDILDDMGASKLSAKVFLKVNYSFKGSNSFCNPIFSECSQTFGAHCMYKGKKAQTRKQKRKAEKGKRKSKMRRKKRQREEWSGKRSCFVSEHLQERWDSRAQHNSGYVTELPKM